MENDQLILKGLISKTFKEGVSKNNIRSIILLLNVPLLINLPEKIVEHSVVICLVISAFIGLVGAEAR